MPLSEACINNYLDLTELRKCMSISPQSINNPKGFLEYAPLLLTHTESPFEDFNRFRAHFETAIIVWAAGYVTEIKDTGYDILSGPFTGCYFVLYKRDNVRYVGHIGTDRDADKTKTVKVNWLNAFPNPSEIITCFNPFEGRVATAQTTYGLISKGKCYALDVTAVNAGARNRYKIIDRREITGISGTEMNSRFFSSLPAADQSTLRDGGVVV